jgi:hypothetical protein
VVVALGDPHKVPVIGKGKGAEKSTDEQDRKLGKETSSVMEQRDTLKMYAETEQTKALAEAESRVQAQKEVKLIRDEALSTTDRSWNTLVTYL